MESIGVRRARLRPLTGAAAIVTAGALVAACGSSSSSSGSTSTTTAPTTSVSSGSTATTTGGTAKAPSGTPYYIGAELSLTGAYASFETPMLSGLQVAVEEINASGGVLGHPVALAYQSDGSDPTKVTPALQSIFSGGRKFFYMLPNVLPNVTDIVLQYTQKYGIASFDAGSGPGIFDVSQHPYNYSIYPANSVQIPAYLAAFNQLTGGAASGVKLGVINDTEAADETLSGLIATGLKQAGGQVVDTESVDPTATDVSVQVQKAKQAGANVLEVQASGNIATEVAEAVQQLDWTTVKIVVSPADNNAQTLSSIPKSVQAQYFGVGEQIYLRNSAGTGPLAKYQSFADLLSKTSGGINDLEISANIADSAVLAAWAVNQAGTLDISKVSGVLNNLSTTPPPSNLLTWLPNPGWTAADHGFDHANLNSTWWALLNPGSPLQGTYPGQALTIP